MTYLKEDLLDIIEKERITPVFQPIVSLSDGSIIGYEALSRIVDAQIIKNPEELFKLAGIFDKNWELEQICRKKIFAAYHKNTPTTTNSKLFINVNPMVIHDKQSEKGVTSRILKQYNLSPENIIFEVTEHSAVDDTKGFCDTIRHYKSQGYQVAVDDAGSCYSGLNLICDIVPHYLKLDYSLIHDLNKDAVKFAMVKSLVEFSNLTNIKIIAEGIETEKELKTLLKLGVHYGQGYFLRKPDSKLLEIEPKALDIIKKYNLKHSQIIANNSNKEFCVMFFELSNTKAYRAYCSKYGDSKGEEILHIIQNSIDVNLSEDETLSILSEGTLVAIMLKENHKLKCETIITMFKNNLQNFYSKKDWENGYIEGTLSTIAENSISEEYTVIGKYDKEKNELSIQDLEWIKQSDPEIVLLMKGYYDYEKEAIISTDNSHSAFELKCRELNLISIFPLLLENEYASYRSNGKNHNIELGKLDQFIYTPNWRIRFLPSFCFSKSFFFLVISPP